MFDLHKISPSVSRRKRVGRGGKRGGTSGKGHKGQKARSGPKIDPGFEGGQMPLYRRLPKRGFTNAPFKRPVVIVDIARLADLYSDGQEVTREQLLQEAAGKAAKGVLGSIRVKVLGNGDLNKKLIVHADLFSKGAADSITRAGGQVCTTEEQ